MDMKKGGINYTIKNSGLSDIETIFELYALATEIQKKNFKIHWPVFEKALIEEEIAEKHQWKIMIENQIACIWATTFSDPKIWGSKDSDPSVYIHRIAVNPKFRGQNMVEKIILWAKEFGKTNGKKYLRMDTVGKNDKLIIYYCSQGFNLLTLKKLKDVSELPEHYQKDRVCLFEMKID